MSNKYRAEAPRVRKRKTLPPRPKTPGSHHVPTGFIEYTKADGTKTLIPREHPWRWVKDAKRQATWAKNKHMEFLEQLRKEKEEVGHEV